MRSTVRRFHHDLEKARLDCEEAVRLEPTNPWAYLMRGLVAAERRDSKNAIVDFEKVIRLDKRIAVAAHRPGALPFECERRRQNRGCFERGDRAGIRPSSRRTCCGECSGRKKVTAGKRSAISTKRFVWIRNGRGLRAARADYYRSVRKFDKALADANEAIRLDPTDGGRYITRARIAYEMGDLEKAVADLDNATRSNPRDVQMLVVRARIASLSVTRSRRHRSISTRRCESTARLTRRSVCVRRWCSKAAVMPPGRSRI